MPYLGWTIVTIPGSPPAPASIELSVVNIVSGNQSPFTGQMQIYDWNASYMKASVAMPPLAPDEAQTWVAFLRSLKGIAGVFQFSAEFMAAYPNDVGTRYWRLMDNTVRWSINPSRYYGVQFECREAL